MGINGSQLAEKKKVFLSCYFHEIYRVEAVGLEKLQLYLQNYDFCEYAEFGAISWKIDILPITSYLKLKS